MNDPKTPRTYSKEEVASILSRGLDLQHEGGRISHDELLETAREIGMTTLEIEAAVADEARQRAERMVLEEQQERAVRGFLKHLIMFVVVSVLVVVIAVRLTGGAWYFVGVAAWALAVAVHGARTFLGKKAAEPPKAALPTRVEVRSGKLELRVDQNRDQRRSTGR
jgi:Flp pilus assembly protein TadB